jgi:hypothetical protein
VHPPGCRWRGISTGSEGAGYGSSYRTWPAPSKGKVKENRWLSFGVRCSCGARVTRCSKVTGERTLPSSRRVGIFLLIEKSKAENEKKYTPQCDKRSKTVLKGCPRIQMLLSHRRKPFCPFVASFILPTFFVHPSRLLPLSIPERSSIRPKGREGSSFIRPRLFVYPSHPERCQCRSIRGR